MYLLKTIIFIGLGIILIHCGNNESETVKVAKVEDGVAKAEDGRIILSSQSEEGLVIPEGKLKGLSVDATQLANAIARRNQRVQEVYDLSMASGFYLDEIVGFSLNKFTTSFSVKTVSGEIYHGIECQTTIDSSFDDLILSRCENDQVVVKLSRFGFISLRTIVVDKQELAKKISELQLKKEI